MKIAILSFYSGRLIRGAETWAENFQKNLQDKISVEIISGWKSYLPFFWKNADVVVSVNGRVQVLIARLATWITRKPLVIWGNSGPGADDKWNLLCCPNIFVVLSESQREWANKYKLPWTKIKLMHHAVDTKEFFPDINTPKENDVLCIAADVPAKRVNLVEDAMKLLPKLKFLHVGKNSVHTKYSELPNIYRKSKVFCMVPVPWESFGLVFLEAMASGLPIVTMDDPIRREIVGPAGIYVKNPENAQELADAITRALKTDWKNIPREQAEKFSWNKTALEYEKMFTGL